MRSSHSSTLMMLSCTTSGTAKHSSCRLPTTSFSVTAQENCSRRRKTARRTSIRRRYWRHQQFTSRCLLVFTGHQPFDWQTYVSLRLLRELSGPLTGPLILALHGTSPVRRLVQSSAKCPLPWRSVARRPSHCTVSACKAPSSQFLTPTIAVVSDLDILKIFKVSAVC